MGELKSKHIKLYLISNLYVSDIDECSFLNGGCQDVCSNNPGFFTCSCQGNKTLESDGKTCSGIWRSY